ncbi:unnamed protein product [Linum trigynum]|uniref:Pentatricopeptide repeat-containing protein n=1 Tax=Linum trigynum TaxID=586398 RepID=A0AAV2CDW3_9ROSI
MACVCSVVVGRAPACGLLTLVPRFSSTTRVGYRKLRKNHQSPRRSKLPPDFGVNLFLKKPTTESLLIHDNGDSSDDEEEAEAAGEVEEDGNHEDLIDWEQDEIEAISSLFQGRIPQKPGKLTRERPLPLPLPHKIRPLRLPTPKKRYKFVPPKSAVSTPSSISNQLHKNPVFLIDLAKRISGLKTDENASLVLKKHARFLSKGSLSLTIRELGHMGLPERALETFCWAQNQPDLVPDDRILASTVEVLARNHDLKVPFDWQSLTTLASRGVMEAMIRGFIRGGKLQLALKLVSVAKRDNRVLDAGIYAKLALELIKNPDKHSLVAELLEELGNRDALNLTQQDCTALMKVSIRLGKFEIVEGLCDWFKLSRREPSVVMYTTLIHSRYTEKKYRDALAVVWEMEGSNVLLDLPAYRVIIKICVALNDLQRASRYFSKLKEAGFSPTYDMYKDLVKVHMASGRLAKSKVIWKEAEVAGFKFDKPMCTQFLQLEREQG